MLLQQIAMTVAEGGEHAPAPIWAEPWVFGASIFAILLVMMFVTLSYSNLGNRHTVTDEHADPHRQHPNKHDHGQGH
ncbi:hypothetical protein [Pseudarthrobacter raffinosi]|uniref:hypothetical protein n=1 Tax=Pseudarthrobacter raffinosi TaxID=2953651 RepID=UPI00208DF588|nr:MULTISPECIES: hypothetical protein [unclassified Pseudarthrobacter]MCO4237191.1 hypothetical protein [Pseudarthrobacter sp. MDT3-28]MCO4251414.1 hypothetical protein [Pseudarthrobacter sp. MDT3-9]MCO4261903.1 hypothetical protein [Pseudarthrobacter sp. MDT3-26]